MEKKRANDLEKRYPDSNVDCPNDDSVTDGDEGDKTHQPSKEKRSKSKRNNNTT